MKVLKTATAWESIGFDEGKFRIKGGRALYEAVMYNCVNNARMVKLARLKICAPNHPGGIPTVREVSRYVEPDTILEFVEIKEYASLGGGGVIRGNRGD